MKITVDREDREWLQKGVVNELMQQYGLEKKAADALFNNSQLLSMLEEMPEYIFHYDTKYWAKKLIQNK